MTSELEFYDVFGIEGARFTVTQHTVPGTNHVHITLPNGYQVSCIPEYNFGMGEIATRPGEMEIAFMDGRDHFVRPLPEYDYDDVIRHLTIDKAVELVKRVAALAPRKDEQ